VSASAAALSEGDRRRFMDAAMEVARFAGARADSMYRRRAELVVEVKGLQDFVSVADRRTEQLILEELAARFPDHAFFGEEGEKASPKAGQPTWVVDPIDGTTNFLRGLPIYAVSIGLIVDGVPQVGVIHSPREDEMFAAAAGLGATLDGAPIAPSKTTELRQALIGVGSSRRTGTPEVNALYRALTDSGVEVRRLGSACVQLAAVACGRLDGYVEMHLNAWDVVAGLCILREAGARTNDFLHGDWLNQGNPFCCAAPSMYDALFPLSGIER
jgi:myo-inositol-1(or 4)-monophosphatase